MSTASFSTVEKAPGHLGDGFCVIFAISDFFFFVSKSVSFGALNSDHLYTGSLFHLCR